MTVAVVADSDDRVKSIAAELGLVDVIRVPVDSQGGHMPSLTAVLVDETVWPISQQLFNALAPCLDRHGGQLYVLHHPAWDDLALLPDAPEEGIPGG